VLDPLSEKVQAKDTQKA